MSSFEETFKTQEAALDAIYLDCIREPNDEKAVGILPAIMGLVEGYSTHKYGNDPKRAEKLCAFKICHYLHKFQRESPSSIDGGMPKTLGFLFGKLALSALREPVQKHFLLTVLMYQIGNNTLIEKEKKSIRDALRETFDTTNISVREVSDALHKSLAPNKRFASQIRARKPNAVVFSSLLHMVARYGDIHSMTYLLQRGKTDT